MKQKDNAQKISHPQLPLISNYPVKTSGSNLTYLLQLPRLLQTEKFVI